MNQCNGLIGLDHFILRVSGIHSLRQCCFRRKRQTQHRSHLCAFYCVVCMNIAWFSCFPVWHLVLASPSNDTPFRHLTPNSSYFEVCCVYNLSRLVIFPKVGITPIFQQVLIVNSTGKFVFLLWERACHNIWNTSRAENATKETPQQLIVSTCVILRLAAWKLDFWHNKCGLLGTGALVWWRWMVQEFPPCDDSETLRHQQLSRSGFFLNFTRWKTTSQEIATLCNLLLKRAFPCCQWFSCVHWNVDSPIARVNDRKMCSWICVLLSFHDVYNWNLSITFSSKLQK